MFLLKARGIKFGYNEPRKIAKFCCGEYCTGYCITSYAQPGTRVIGAEEKAFLGGALVAKDSPEFCVIHDIPIFSPVPLILFNHLDVTIS